MKITNNYNLPEPLYKAIVNDKYVRTGDISVTQLIDSFQIRHLKYKHRDELTEDATNMIWSLFGSANHVVIERAGEYCPDYLSEIGLQVNVLGKVLSGTADLYDKKNKILYDFKVTSVWNLVLNNDHWSWEAQLNTYAYMLRQEGYEVNEIRIIAILKDWKQSEIGRNYPNGTYPPKQVEEVNLKVYSDAQMLKYIEKRMQLHIDAENGNVPECNERERWAKPDEFAVKDPKKQRAMRVLHSADEAEVYREEQIAKGKENLQIEIRKGRNIRCEGYCPVAPFCEQNKRL